MTSHLIMIWAAFLILAVTETFTQRLGDRVHCAEERMNIYMRESELNNLQGFFCFFFGE